MNPVCPAGTIVQACPRCERQPCVRRVAFFAAQPQEESLFDALRAEAVAAGDLVVLPGITEHYLNITYQTLEILRAASMDAAATHTLKAGAPLWLRRRLLCVLVMWLCFPALFWR